MNNLTSSVILVTVNYVSWVLPWIPSAPSAPATIFLLYTALITVSIELRNDHVIPHVHKLSLFCFVTPHVYCLIVISNMLSIRCYQLIHQQLILEWRLYRLLNMVTHAAVTQLTCKHTQRFKSYNLPCKLKITWSRTTWLYNSRRALYFTSCTIL